MTLSSTNLYFICKKPRLRVVEGLLYLKDNSLYIGFELSSKEGNKQQFWIINNYHSSEPTFTVSQSNRSRIHHDRGTGTMPIEGLLHYLMHGMHVENPNIWFKQFEYKYVNSFEVLYIGKSFLKEGVRSAFDRVRKHEKLQEIISYILTNEPYDEVFVMFIEMSEAKGIFVLKDKSSSQGLEYKLLKEMEHRANISKGTVIKYS